MRIIKEGVLPEERMFKGRCSNCGCVFECAKIEGKFYEDQRDGTFLKVLCPLCNSSAYAYPARGLYR